MFIITPRLGLCNQLQTIIKGILLAIKFNRNLYIDKFQIDLSTGKLEDIDNILDIDYINKYLTNEIKTNIKIINNIEINKNYDSYYLPNVDYSYISNISYLNDIIELNNNMNIIFLGNIVSLNIDQSFNFKYNDYSNNNLYYLISYNIRFHHKFYEIKDFIKKELNLYDFHCIHLRIEDDALKHFAHCFNLSIDEYNKKLITFYEENIKNLTEKNENKKIYLCSGILEFDNTINLSFYENLKNNNKLLVDKKNISLDKYYLNNRELIAIIDLLISYESDNFIGCGISSFSQVINTHHTYKNNKSILF